MLSKLKLRSKLVIMLLVPVIGMLYFSIVGVIERNQAVKEMRKVEKLSDLGVKISALVHETQKERGRTAGFLGSGGKNFLTELSAQRKLVDQRISILQDFLKSFDKDVYSMDFNKDLQKALDDLKGIQGLRSQVSALSVSTHDAIAYYTAMNAAFLNAIGAMAKLTKNAEVANQIVAYVNFLMSKERAGIERAILSNTFARDSFGPGMYNKFTMLISEQDVYMNVFLSLASEKAKEEYRTIVRGKDVDEVIRMRKIVLKGGGGFGVDPTYWFSKITNKINLLKEVEDMLSEKLVKNSMALRKAAFSQVVIYFIIMIVGGIITFLLAGYISVKLPARMNRIMEVAKKIADGDLKQKVLMISGSDEVGQLENVFNQMLSGLGGLVNRAEDIAAGKIGADEIEKEMKKGKDIAAAAAAAAAAGDIKGDLAGAFNLMQGQLRILTVQARLIARDQLEHPALELAQEGELGEAFTLMKKNLLRFAQKAQAIADDDLENAVLRDELDTKGTLGSAFSQMSSNLGGLAQKAQIIAGDDLLSEQLSIEGTGTLASAFAKMVRNLRILAEQARLIACGDLQNPKLTTDGQGTLSKAFSEVVKNLRTLAAQADAIADLDLVKPILKENVTGDLGMAFQKMVRNLKDFAMEVHENVMNLERVGEEVVASAGTLNQTGRELSEGAQEQSASLEETSASVEEITSMVQRSSENAEAARKESYEMKEKVSGGAEQIKEMAGLMKTIHEDSSKIAETTKAIDSISFQTNLLALNAAVEAANAGEHGAGFAVVADEVRRLAQRSAESAEEITKIVEVGIAKTREGVEKSDAVRTSLDEMIAKVTGTAKRTEDIAQGAQEQARGIEEINKAMHELRSVTEKNTEGASETAAAADQLKSLSDSLGDVVTNLRGVAERFQLEETGKEYKVARRTQHGEIKENMPTKSTRKETSSMSTEEKILPLEDDKGGF